MPKMSQGAIDKRLVPLAALVEVFSDNFLELGQPWPEPHLFGHFQILPTPSEINTPLVEATPTSQTSYPRPGTEATASLD